MLNESQGHNFLKQRQLDFDRTTLYSVAQKTCSPREVGIISKYGTPAAYFSLFTSPQIRRAFMLTRFNVLSSEIVFGWFTSTPHHKRLCSCGRRQPESIAHVLFYCGLYGHVQDSLISRLLFSQHGCSDKRLVFLFVSDQCPSITYTITLYLLIAKWIREHTVKSTADWFYCILELSLLLTFPFVNASKRDWLTEV